MAKNNSEEFDFHYFVDAVKQKKIRWHMIWIGISTQFMKAARITNVKIVVNHFLAEEIWIGIFTQFMKATKISNVSLVENHLLFCQTWEVISKSFLKFTNITK